jgi:hypothetical protein
MRLADAIRLMPMPWIDRVIGRRGTVSFAEWDAAMEHMDRAIAREVDTSEPHCENCGSVTTRSCSRCGQRICRACAMDHPVRNYEEPQEMWKPCGPKKRRKAARAADAVAGQVE